MGTGGPPRLAGALLYAFFTWTLVGLFIGIFVRFMAAERTWVAWLSDAAYWIYLVHLPICVFLQVWVAPWPWWGPIKYTLVAFGTLALSLGTYRLFVRHSWIGAMLHGPTKP